MLSFVLDKYATLSDMIFPANQDAPPTMLAMFMHVGTEPLTLSRLAALISSEFKGFLRE